MMGGMLSFLIGFAAIALMVTIHETGHFLAARIMGITVETFAIGWGRAILRWRTKGVEYRINIFPLGGYCKLKGSEDLRRSLDEGGASFSTAEPGSLFFVSPLRRIATYLAGPLANLIFALLVFSCFFALGHDAAILPARIVLTSDYPAIFDTDTSQPHAARDGGLRSGDIVTSIDGVPTPDFSMIQRQLALQETGSPTRFSIIRGDEALTLDIHGIEQRETGKPFFGISYELEPVVGRVDPLSPEAVAGLEVGDRILAVLGVPVDNTWDVLQILEDDPQVISLLVEDEDGGQRLLSCSPLRDEHGGLSLGFAFSRIIERRDGQPFAESMKSGLAETARAVTDTLTLLPRLLQGAFALDEVVAGPLRISYVIGETREAGLRALLHLMAMVSVSLAAANLLPIPGLDGGSILLSLIELVAGRTISPRMYVRFQSFGLAFLMVLMVLVVAGDLRFIFSGP